MSKNNNKERIIEQGFKWKVLVIFSIIIVISCALVFLLNIDIAYDDGGYIPRNWVVGIYYFVLTIVALAVASVIKIIYKDRVRLWQLLLISFILPILCYAINYHAYKKGGPLHSLVDYGGIFHFIAIGDWDFDGINDEYYSRMSEERTVSFLCGVDYNDDLIKNISVEVTGSGLSLDRTFCDYDWEKQVIKLHINKNHAEYKNIDVKIEIYDSGTKNYIELYINDEQIDYKTINENKVCVSFDSDECIKWQNSSDSEFIEIPIKYIVKSN
jgi:hypothetical protein